MCLIFNLHTKYKKKTNVDLGFLENLSSKGTHSYFSMIFFPVVMIPWWFILWICRHIASVQENWAEECDLGQPKRPSDLRALLFLVLKCSYLNWGTKNSTCFSQNNIMKLMLRDLCQYWPESLDGKCEIPVLAKSTG